LEPYGSPGGAIEPTLNECRCAGRTGQDRDPSARAGEEPAMNHRTIASLVGASAIAAACSLTGCESAQSTVSIQSNGVPYHENAVQTWWHYQFVYYPDEQVYYEPFTGTYWWFEQGSWWPGSKLPDQFQLEAETAEIVYLQQDRPYLQHGTVLALYPVLKQPNNPAFDPRAWRNGAMQVATEIGDR
jgi:hypothetical protein